jgi:hypothetical protein
MVAKSRCSSGPKDRDRCCKRQRERPGIHARDVGRIERHRECTDRYALAKHVVDREPDREVEHEVGKTQALTTLNAGQGSSSCAPTNKINNLSHTGRSDLAKNGCPDNIRDNKSQISREAQERAQAVEHKLPRLGSRGATSRYRPSASLSSSHPRSLSSGSMLLVRHLRESAGQIAYLCLKRMVAERNEPRAK